MKKLLLSGVAVIAMSAPVLAQTEFAPGSHITGVTTINEHIRDVEDAVRDDFDHSNDMYRHGFNRQDGLRGGVSLSYGARSGNSEAQNLAVGARVYHSQGPFSQNVGVAVDYSKNDAGETDRRDVSAIYDGSYDLSPRAYGFMLGRASVDGTVSDDVSDYLAGILPPAEAADLDGRVKRDAFLGFGPGYRLIDRPDTTWRVQAGVGVRYTQQVALAEADGLISDTSTGYIASSRFWYEFNDKVFVTNDTDYLKSDANKAAFNELGLNYKFSDNLLGRASYQTDYVSDRAIRSDNRLGLSVGFQF